MTTPEQRDFERVEWLDRLHREHGLDGMMAIDDLADRIRDRPIPEANIRRWAEETYRRRRDSLDAGTGYDPDHDWIIT